MCSVDDFLSHVHVPPEPFRRAVLRVLALSERVRTHDTTGNFASWCCHSDDSSLQRFGTEPAFVYTANKLVRKRLGLQGLLGSLQSSLLSFPWLPGWTGARHVCCFPQQANKQAAAIYLARQTASRICLVMQHATYAICRVCVRLYVLYVCASTVVSD